ncbi:MAG: alcohol dehydrogenase catalytic domain-containing protein [Pseudonocardiaceae bacterium]
MRGTVLYAPGDVRLEQRDDPKITEPTDAIIRMSATCVCCSDLWDYRGINPVTQPTPIGHEYCGIVEEVGSEVRSIKRGQFVIGSFFASDNTCPNCRAGFQSSCQHREFVGGAQAELLRVPLADGTLGRRPHPQPAHPVGRDGDRLVRRRLRQRATGKSWPASTAPLTPSPNAVTKVWRTLRT